MNLQIYCPTPGKLVWGNKAEADAYAKSRRQFGRHFTPYRCKCGGWHVTRRARPRKHQNRIAW